ncbi:YezD family protein [Bacillus sp. CGMCC 1.16607]|uniref:YezD family protein n=1 Tax=Bacillus sp. CGMCC 1.16607 TaxID=3351842 RepID=UPI003640E8E2
MKEINQKTLDHIIDTLKKLEFGSVVVTVHDGKITQVESTEKRRFTDKKID